MQLEFFLAKRIFRSDRTGFSRQMMRITVLSITLCVVVSFLTISIIKGFRENIFDKVSAFGAHITISSYDKNLSFESIPISLNAVKLLDTIQGMESISPYIEKAGIINGEDGIQGVLFKGYRSSDNSNFFKNYIISPNFNHQNRWNDNRNVVISESLSKKLNIKEGDKILCFFIMNSRQQPKARKLLVSGIYKTGFEEFDNRIVFCDIDKLRRINDWGDSLVSGVEIKMTDKMTIGKTAGIIHNNIDYNLKAETIAIKYPHIFEWLGLQDINAIVIIVLIMIISTITIISYLLVIIIEKASVIGLLKAMGATNLSIRKTFINYIMIVSIIGLVIGNIISIIIIWLQKTFHIIKLPEETYYISYVPVSIGLTEIILANVIIISIIAFALYIPSSAINRFSPVKAIKID